MGIEQRELNLKIAYTGSAVEGGKMDVVVLGKSLTALGELFQLSNSIISKDNSSINLKLSRVSDGSFEIYLEALKTGYQLSQTLGIDITDISSVGAINGIPAGALIATFSCDTSPQTARKICSILLGRSENSRGTKD